MTGTVTPCHHEAAIRKRHDIGQRLIRRRVAIDPELISNRGTHSVKALAVDAVARAILAVGTPRHHVGAIGKCRRRRVILSGVGMAVNLDLAVFILRDRHATIRKGENLYAGYNIPAVITVRRLQIRQDNSLTIRFNPVIGH